VSPSPPGPVIVQSDKTLLLEVDHEAADEARAAIAPFAAGPVALVARRRHPVLVLWVTFAATLAQVTAGQAMLVEVKGVNDVFGHKTGGTYDLKVSLQ